MSEFFKALLVLVLATIIAIIFGIGWVLAIIGPPVETVQWMTYLGGCVSGIVFTATIVFAYSDK